MMSGEEREVDEYGTVVGHPEVYLGSFEVGLELGSIQNPNLRDPNPHNNNGCTITGVKTKGGSVRLVASWLVAYKAARKRKELPIWCCPDLLPASHLLC